VVLVQALPKTRSGKLLRRLLSAVCEDRDAGDTSTLEDPGVLAQVQALWAQSRS
jgi:propionyl-CoA synthetase